MTNEKLVDLMMEFIRSKDPQGADEWYATDRWIYGEILIDFVKWLRDTKGIKISDAQLGALEIIRDLGSVRQLPAVPAPPPGEWKYGKKFLGRGGPNA